MFGKHFWGESISGDHEAVGVKVLSNKKLKPEFFFVIVEYDAPVDVK